MFNTNELTIIQTGLMENVIEYVRKEHEVGVVKPREVRKDWDMLKSMDTKNMLKHVSSQIPEFESPKKAEDMFENETANIIMFEQMELVHKVDDLLGDELSFYCYMNPDDVADLGLFEDTFYYKSFSEYYNFFISLFAVWQEDEGR